MNGPYIRWIPVALIWAAVSMLAESGPAPASTSKLEIKGVVASVNVRPGGGAPTMTVKAADGRQWIVRLGSIRYLIANSFNPKAGQKVMVQGFKRDGVDIVATQIEFPETHRKLGLRDEEGRPLWRGRGAAPWTTPERGAK